MLSEDGRKPVKPKSCQTRPKQALISSLKGRSNPQWMRHAEKHDNTCPIEAQTMPESARLARNRRWTGNDSGKNGGIVQRVCVAGAVFPESLRQSDRPVLALIR